MKELTIVLPCLNEELTIGRCISSALIFLSENKIDGEVIVVDNGSSDASVEIARKYEVKIFIEMKKGYGAALISGINEANSKYVIWGDSDLSYEFTTSSLMPFVEKLRDGHEVVIGNRFQGGIESGAMPFLNFYLGNPVLSFIGQKLFRSQIRDFHCGLRGCNKNIINLISLNCMGMEFATELIVRAELKRLKVTEVPTRLRRDGRNRKSHLRPWRDGFRHLILMIKLKLKERL
jgi:glycosyltransferase involved in cell wall biosynthesis